MQSVQDVAIKLPSLSEIEMVINKCLSAFALPFSGALAFFEIAKCYPISDEAKDVIDEQSASFSFIFSTFQLPKFFFNQFKLYKACDDLRRSVLGGANVEPSKVFKSFNAILLRADALVGSGAKVLQLLDRLNLIDLSKVSSGLASSLAQGKNLLSVSSSSAALVDSILVLRDQIKKEQALHSDEVEGLSLEKKKRIRAVTSKTMGLVNHLKSSATPKGKNLISLSSSMVAIINSIWSLSDQIEKEQEKQSGKKEGLSLGTKKEIRIVATNAVKLILDVIKTAALILCTRANPFTLALLSVISFALSLVKFTQENDGKYWESGISLRIKNSSHLPA